jgi:hypothetical protein
MASIQRDIATFVVTTTTRLVERAIQIVSAPPFAVHVDEPRFAVLRIEAETAVLCWPAWKGDYPGLDVKQISFPAALLEITDSEFRGWKRVAR